MRLTNLVDPLDPGWDNALGHLNNEFEALGTQLRQRKEAGEHILPAPENILRAFRQPFESVKVLIVGQDPYPTPGHPMGMSFSLNPDVRPLARSLTNIYRELHDDVGVEPAAHGDLSCWADQGVLLLNRVLTVTAGAPGSHRNLGWERITQTAVEALAARDAPLVALLWGNDARKLAPVIRQANQQSNQQAGSDRILILESAHPSPLSARRGFFGSRPFSKTNAFLTQQGVAPIDWTVH